MAKNAGNAAVHLVDGEQADEIVREEATGKTVMLRFAPKQSLPRLPLRRKPRSARAAAVA